MKNLQVASLIKITRAHTVYVCNIFGHTLYTDTYLHENNTIQLASTFDHTCISTHNTPAYRHHIFNVTPPHTTQEVSQPSNPLLRTSHIRKNPGPQKPNPEYMYINRIQKMKSTPLVIYIRIPMLIKSNMYIKKKRKKKTKYAYKNNLTAFAIPRRGVVSFARSSNSKKSIPVLSIPCNAMQCVRLAKSRTNDRNSTLECDKPMQNCSNRRW